MGYLEDHITERGASGDRPGLGFIEPGLVEYTDDDHTEDVCQKNNELGFSVISGKKQLFCFRFQDLSLPTMCYLNSIAHYPEKVKTQGTKVVVCSVSANWPARP